MTTWQFVADMATPTPTVNLDLNVPPLNVKDYNLSPGDFDKAYAGGAMMDGQRVTHQSANNRFITLTLQVVSPTAAGFSAAIENLGRQLAKDNILKYQPNNSVGPVFFRTFANPTYAAQVRGILICAVQYQLVDIVIEAEYAAYGPRVECVGSPFTVSNDPAAANGCFFDIVSVQGDMPTPLLLHATSTGSTGIPSGLTNKWTHIGMRRRGTPSNYSNVIQAEAMTQGTGAVVTADAAMSGGSKSRIGFASPGMVLRLNDTFPANGVSNIEARGEYRVYARVQKTVANDQINMRLDYGGGSGTALQNDPVALPGLSAGPYWVDLGLVPVPAFSDPIEHGFSGVPLKVVLPWVAVYAERISGSGSLDVDVLYFVPADDLTVITRFPNQDLSYCFDGTTDEGGACYALATTLDEVITTVDSISIVAGGGFPEVIPGQTNRVHFIRHVSPLGGGDTLTSTTTIRVYYWPRWRELTRP